MVRRSTILIGLLTILTAGTGCRHIHAGSPPSPPPGGPVPAQPEGSSPVRAAPLAGPPGPFEASLPELVVHPLAVLGEDRFRDPMGAERGTLAISPDGTLLASGGSDGTLRLFDAAGGELLARLRDRGEPFTQVQFAGARLLITGDEVGSIRLWDLSAGHAQGVQVQTLPVHHTSSIVALSVSRDGTVMMSADYRGNAVAWALPAGKVVSRLSEEQDTGDGVIVSEGDDIRYQLSPDGSRAIVHSSGNGFTVWDTTRWEVVARARWTWSDFTGVAGSVWLPDGETVRVIHRIPESYYDDTPDETAVISDWSSLDGSLREQRAFKVGSPLNYRLATDGRFLAVYDYDRGLRAWRADDGTEIGVPALYNGDADYERLAFTHDGRLLALGGGNALLNVVDLEAGQAAHDAMGSGPTYWSCVALMADGGAALSDGDRLYFWEPGSEQVPRSFAMGPDEMVVGDDGRRLTARGDHLWAMDLRNHQLLYERLDQLGYVMANAMAATPDGDTVVYGGYEGNIGVLDGENGTLRQSLETDDGEIYSLAVSADGRSVASIGGRSRLRVRSLPAGELIHDHDLEHGSEIVGWAGDRVVVVGESLLEIVDLATGEQTLVDEGMRWYAADLSPDGRFLAWAAADASLHLADLEQGARYRIEATDQPATALAFDPAGDHLLVGRLGGRAEVWRRADLEHEELGVTQVEGPAQEPPLEPPVPRRTVKDSQGDALPPYAAVRLGTTRGRAGTQINHVRYTRDGRRVWIVDQHGHVGLWDPSRGQAERMLDLSTSYGRDSVAFTPDDAWVVTYDYDGLSVWDADSGTEVRTREQENIDSMALSPDGRLVATGMEDGGVIVRRVDDLGQVHSFPAFPTRVEHLAFSADSRLLAAISSETVVRIWDMGGSQELEIPSWKEWGSNAMSFSPDGSTLLVATGSWIERFDVASGQQLDRWEASFSPFRMVYSPDGKTLALVGQEPLVELWDVQRGISGSILEGHTDMTMGASFSPDGKTLVSGGNDAQVRFWDVASGQPRHEWPAHAEGIYSVAVSADSKTVFTADTGGMVRRWDAAGGDPAGVRLLEGGYLTVQLVAGDQLAVKASQLTVVDGRTLATQKVYEEIYPDLMALSPDGTGAAQMTQGELVIWDLAGERELHRVPAYSGYATTIEYSSDGAFIASGGTDRLVRVWNAATGEQATAFRGNAEVHDVAFTGSGLLIWIDRQEGCCPTMTAGVLETGEIRWQLELEFSHSDRFALHPNGQYLAASDHEGFRFYDVETGRLVAHIPMEAPYFSSLAFSPDGGFVVTGHGDTTALIWDTSWLP